MRTPSPPQHLKLMLVCPTPCPFLAGDTKRTYGSITEFSTASNTMSVHAPKMNSPTIDASAPLVYLIMYRILIVKVQARLPQEPAVVADDLHEARVALRRGLRYAFHHWLELSVSSHQLRLDLQPSEDQIPKQWTQYICRYNIIEASLTGSGIYKRPRPTCARRVDHCLGSYTTVGSLHG